MKKRPRNSKAGSPVRRGGRSDARRAPAPKTVDEYLAAVPPEFRVALQRLRRTIRSVAPDAEEVLSYGMPAFRQHRILVYFAAFSDHCSLFIGSAEVRRQFSAELKRFQTGKGTLRFTPDRPLPAGLVKRIVRARVVEIESKRSAGRKGGARAGI